MTRFRKAIGLALAPLALAWVYPAAAQEVPFTYGDYWQVAQIQVDDGANAQYIDYLATEYKKSQEFAKSKGWIREYHVLENLNKRPGEADIYLVTVFGHMPDAKESAARDKEYEAYLQKDMRRMEAESGGRAKYRKVLGSELLGEILLK